MRRGQNGFGAIEGFLIAVIILMLGFTGYYVWHARNNANTTYNSATSVSSSANSGTTTSISGTAAKSLVSDFYSKVYQALGGSNTNATPNTAQEKAIVQQNGTANLLSAYNNAQGSDPIVCGQNYAPFSVTSSTASGSKEVVTVHEAFADSPINFTVDVLNSNGLKIDAIHCPQSH